MTEPIRAAQYVRMSTDHQIHSLENQRLTIAAYAAEAGYEVVTTYEDPGQSGLGLQNRPGLQKLLADVLGGEAPFSIVLVYDISRWGRFQDPDQAAHYEFLCREAGVRVEYVSELFRNDGSMTSSLLKTMKRAMAAEFSRELSEKVRRNQRRQASCGFWVGAPAPYGYRRQPVRPDGTRRPTLEIGERNGVEGDRITLVIGPQTEAATVRRIFRERLRGLSHERIAIGLNADGIAPPKGRAWKGSTIRFMLGNEVYTGACLRGRYDMRFGERSPPRAHPHVRVPNAFPALVSRTVFQRVQDTLNLYVKNKPDAQLIAELADLYRRRGRLSQSLINRDPLTSSADVYWRRFGSMEAVYQLVGFTMAERDKRAGSRILLRQAGKAKNRRSDREGRQLAIRFSDDDHPLAGQPRLPRLPN